MKSKRIIEIVALMSGIGISALLYQNCGQSGIGAAKTATDQKVQEALDHYNKMEASDESQCNGIANNVKKALNTLAPSDKQGCVKFSCDSSGNAKSIDGSACELAGPLPSILGELNTLEELHIAGIGSDLSGPIPNELGQLVNLKILNLEFNKFSGSIPFALGNLKNLTRLDLAGNDLEGQIPIVLGNLSNLENLDLSYNSLTGPIPQSLANLSKLRELFLNDNKLSGRIPESVLKINPEYMTIDLSKNFLTGTVPEIRQVGPGVSMYNCDLSYNCLSSPYPAKGCTGFENQSHCPDGLNGSIVFTTPISTCEFDPNRKACHTIVSGSLVDRGQPIANATITACVHYTDEKGFVPGGCKTTTTNLSGLFMWTGEVCVRAPGTMIYGFWRGDKKSQVANLPPDISGPMSVDCMK